MAGSDHLIERAAALLRAGQGVRLRDADRPGDVVIAPEQQAPAFQRVPDAPLAAPPTLRQPAGGPFAGGGQTVGDQAVGDQTVGDQKGALVPSPEQAGTALRAEPAQPAPVLTLDVLENAGMVVARTTRTRISEEYRIVIGRVLRALRAEPAGSGAHNVLMVTSARPNEGKSFSALNLAGSIAQHGNEKVLLIDLDAKLKPISAQLGVGDRIGLQDLVANPSLRPEDVILDTAIANLSFLPVGTRIGEGLDVTSVRPTPPTITRIARRFPKHLIVIDAPPCLSTSDPHTIAPFVGQVVMVVEAERTQRTEVEAAIDLVRVCPTITILLNKVRLTTSHTFGAYDYYGSYT